MNTTWKSTQYQRNRRFRYNPDKRQLDTQRLLEANVPPFPTMILMATSITPGARATFNYHQQDLSEKHPRRWLHCFFHRHSRCPADDHHLPASTADANHEESNRATVHRAN
jgi:hypothetical protein